MAQFLRGKQAGIQNDLSAGIDPTFFLPDDVARFGVNSQIGTIAYDPVQSLLAVGTNESQYGSGKIYIFGQKRVAAAFDLRGRASVRMLQFCADKLISVDSKSNITIFSLETRLPVAQYTPMGVVTSLVTDPCMDWAFLGLQNGEVIAYDLDRDKITPFRIPNLLKARDPRARFLPIVTMALHPRDIGTLLIGYPEAAVIFSFKQNKPLKYFDYELAPGAPGGDSDPASTRIIRRPRLTQAVWHPTGTFIATGHEDSSIVIWDPKDGRIVMARTLQETDIDKPGAAGGNYSTNPGTFSVKEPIFKLAWCCKQNPDDTGLLVAGGGPTTTPTKGLTFLDLGPTPVYATSTWQVFSDHFRSPKRQYVLHTPPQAEMVDFCLIPRSSPHFAGANDPIAVIALMSSGEILTLSFPSGHPISPTNQLHLSLTYVHPFVNKVALAQVSRSQWLAMTENRSRGPPILRGGAEATHTMKRHEDRNIIQTAHADGTVRLWDSGHGDEIENEGLLQVDVALALGRPESIEVTEMSMSGATGELAVGTANGELVIFRWEKNRNFGQPPRSPVPAQPTAGMIDIKERANPDLKEGLLPFTMLQGAHGPVTAVKIGDVGFVGVGYRDGSMAVVDLRGPAVIFTTSLSELTKGGNKRLSIRRSDSHSDKPEWATCMEFGVMTLEGDDYSSILLFVGTNLGRFATFKLLPDSNGRYTVQFAGATSLDDRVISIDPITIDTGAGAYATQSAVANLRNGVQVHGVVLVVLQSGVRLFKPPMAKGASKSWDEFFCDSATVIRYQDRGYALLGLFGDGSARIYSIPALKQIAEANIGSVLEPKRLPEALISSRGELFGWCGPSEMAMMNVWGSGDDLTRPHDKIFNPEAFIPPRPTISNLQWIAGTQYVSPADMDVLIGGPDRPPSKRMLEQARAEEHMRRMQGAGGRPGSSSPRGAPENEGYWAYMQRQLNERTEKLGIMGDSMDRLEENSSGWAEDVSKFVGQQKRKALFNAIKPW